MRPSEPAPSASILNSSADNSAIERLTPAQQECLTDVLDSYLSALENGVPPRPEDLLKEHPDLARPLQVYLDSLNELHSAAAGFRHPVDHPAAAAWALGERRLGDFVLGDEIGRGGMGVVYEAQQISLGRRVAVKVLPFAAVLDAKQIARFKNEARAAAQLHHPHIVPVFAVGAERGVHYYAMQFVDGQPLDRAIDELRGQDCGHRPRTTGDTVREHSLTARSFLAGKASNRCEYFRVIMQLGIEAATALHAAHELGVVHRDIKPSNLLLDHTGHLWVTDFGLARCQSDLPLSRSGDVVGTMRYMSPEQALGQTALVDHRSDIYALGITLYELLALRPAFPDDDPQALLRQIQYQEPRRLSQLCPDIPADLETVICKALAKQRDERYATAEHLADDLQRVLEGKPTLARPPTMAERLGKWARRHRRLVTAAALIGMLLMLGSATAAVLVLHEKSKADNNLVRAERNFREARDAVDRLGAGLAEQLADIPGAEQVRGELLRDTLGYYQRFVRQAGSDPSLRSDLAATYSEMGTLTDNIGSSQEAVNAHQQAVLIFQQLVAEQPRMSEFRRRLAVSQNNLGSSLRRVGRIDEARQAFREAIRIGVQLEADEPENRQYPAELASAHANLGLLLNETGALDAAEQELREAIRLQEKLASQQPGESDTLANLAASYNNLSALCAESQPARAVKLYQQAQICLTRAAAARPDKLSYQSASALTWSNLGAVQAALAQFSDAAASYGRAIAIQDQLVHSAPDQKSFSRDLAVSYNNLGLTQTRMAQPAAAETSFLRALELQERLVQQNPIDVGLHSRLGGIYNNRGIVLEELHRPQDAAECYHKAVEHQQVAFSKAPEILRYRLFLSKHYFNLGRVLRQLGRGDEAAQVALARKQLWPKDAERLFSVAEELALASRAFPSAAVANSSHLTADECADLAVDVLREAVEEGFQLPANLEKNEAFHALKGRPRYAELIRS